MRLEPCCRAPSASVRSGGTEVCGPAAARPGSNERAEARYCGRELGSDGAILIYNMYVIHIIYIYIYDYICR